jgi:hypothetical protein
MTKVLILGAGASHGHGAKNEIRTPLANGFFDPTKYAPVLEIYKPLIKYVRENTSLESVNNHMDIEAIFSQIEPLWKLRGLKDMDFDRVRKLFGEPFLYISPPVLLHAFITDMITFTTWWLNKTTCPCHSFIAKNWLDEGDTVISFNYDLIMDIALLRSNVWHPSTGYGWRNPDVIGIENNITESNVTLLKLHGSTNWYKSKTFKLPNLGSKYSSKDFSFDSKPSISVVSPENSIQGKWTEMDTYSNKDLLRFRVHNLEELHAYGEFKGMPEYTEAWNELQIREGIWENNFKELLPLLILPTPYKSLEDMAFAELSELWHKARSALEESEIVVATGFSFRDIHFNQFIRLASQLRGKPLILKVATRIEDEFNQIKKGFIQDNIKVEWFNGWFEDLTIDFGYSPD